MNISRIKLSEKWFFTFPVLFAIYPIVFLYSNNVEELLLPQLYIPVAIAFVATIICWAVLFFLIKDTLKTGIIATVFIIFFFTYGTLFDWLVSLNLFAVKHWHILPVVLVITGYSGYFVYLIKNRELIINVAKILTMIVTILVVLNSINIIPHEMKKIEYSNQKPVMSEIQQSNNQFFVNQTGKYPDIYYFVLDEYASSSTIKSMFDYDNSEFENYLREKGFYIAENSTTRYHESMLSLSTSLNMEYPGTKISHLNFTRIMDAGKEFDYLGFGKTELYDKVNNNQVSSFLRSQGYTLVVIDNFYTRIPAKGRMMSDINYNYLDENTLSFIDDFSLILIKTSMLKPFTYIFEQQQPGIRDTYTTTRYGTLYSFSKIPEIEKIKGPKFVFIHLLCPHAPFVFDQNGNDVNRKYALNWKEKIYYRDQYIYISNQMASVVDVLLGDPSKEKPVIIIQSDHGPRSSDCVAAEECLDIPVDDKFKIFNAYYFPGNCTNSLYQNISPVNSFRVTFNCYFNGNYTLLEDE
jgi:hypothetical protein